MLKIKHSQLNWLLAGMTLAVMGVSITPASAQSVIVIDGGYGVRQSPAVGSFIYGSPIPTPMPVDPTTGLIPQRNYYRDYSYPQFRQNVRNSTLVNPTYPNYSYPQFRQNLRNSTLINPTIRDSTLVNPVIINNNSWHRTPFSGGRSRVIITYPR
ncbi:MAG: hypothetical protein V7K89_02485 [Nostoc sp.]|uniref:hypothetical protein n=1 Tax=Nostoc sp. TaxID=1180 RepID=UPI002FFC703A